MMLSDEENGVILMKDIEIENVGLINDTNPPTVDFATIDGVVRKSALLGVWVIMIC